MSLISCPECGLQISDRAALCVHCGYPLAHDRANARYTLVLLEGGADSAAAEKVLSKYLTLSVQEAGDLLSAAPAVLVRGLTRREARDIADALGKVCAVTAVSDRDAVTREDALCAQAADLEHPAERPAGVPLTFQQTVGAILASLALWTAAIWILAGLMDLL